MITSKKQLVLVGIRRKGESGFKIRTVESTQKGMTLAERSPAKRFSYKAAS